MLPLCFVLMPCAQQPAADGTLIDFDAVYDELIAPGVADARLEVIRAEQQPNGGEIRQPIFEQLLLCEFAVVDLSLANADLFYALGLREALRPASTLRLFAESAGPPLPFDVERLRALPCKIGADGRPVDIAAGREAIAARLREACEQPAERAVFQLVEDFPDIQRLKTDVFRDCVSYSSELKARLAAARQQGAAAVRAVAATLGGIADLDAGVLIDLYLSYRAVKAWPEMIALVPQMSAPLARSVLVQEQLGLALNREGRPAEAEAVLLAVLEKTGPSSETCSLLGRVYKDGWETAVQSGATARAESLLEQAIAAYLKGFEADWRDAYPGINTITLMELRNPPDPRREQLIPVVCYAVDRRMAAGQPDYWDHATRLELAILGKDQAAAAAALGECLASMREVWEPESTARNLRLIGAARAQRGEQLAWAADIERELLQRAAAS